MTDNLRAILRDFENEALRTRTPTPGGAGRGDLSPSLPAPPN